MARVLMELVRSLFGGAQGDPERDRELVLAHRDRCLHFKTLLSANSRALSAMTDIEDALDGERSFGMPFVRERCTTSLVEVHRMVAALDGLTPDRYRELFTRYDLVRSRVEKALEAASDRSTGPLCLPFSKIRMSHAAEVGGKMAVLGEAESRLPCRTPGGFVVTASAFRRFVDGSGLGAEIARRIQAAGEMDAEESEIVCRGIRELILGAELPQPLLTALRAQVDALVVRFGPGVGLAVRSSAVGEDAAGASFAGQFRTVLGVLPDGVEGAYKDVVAALWTPAALAYRAGRGLLDQDAAMCVGVLPMIDAAKGGVAYSKDPLDPASGDVLVEAAWGLPASVVDGSLEPDRFRVPRNGDGVVEVSPGRKGHMVVLAPEGGVARVPVETGRAEQPCLTKGESLRVAELAMGLERLFGVPQDVEWAIDASGVLVLLQSRSLGLMESVPEPALLDVLGPREEGEVLCRGGVTVSPGGAYGPAHVLRSEAEADDFPTGGVLVAVAPEPHLALLLPRAGAVVTERGGRTGHLATVAREMGVPAIFGLRDAATQLQGAGVVTVDATNCRVWRGVHDIPRIERRGPGERLRGSPVWRVLKQAAAHIVPLNLLDPDAREFSPEGCKTLHDITRFCHEQAVRDLFESGSDLPVGASRRLVSGTRMQFWVVDLGGGIAAPATADAPAAPDEGQAAPAPPAPTTADLDVERIVCRPMRALWRGMTSVPWEGPPAPDARGFLSVIAQAASNPDLDPARASSFQERSFFLISKDFCSLHSRFGFHFSIIEALLGDSPAESYASMRFKGGAADPERRARRAHMVGEVLRDMGFSVDVRRDALTARIEGVEPAELEARLEALGFLSLHTRQMDMVMGDPVRTGECRARLLRGLAALPGGGGLAAPAAPGSSGPQDASAPTDATAGRTTA